MSLKERLMNKLNLMRSKKGAGGLEFAQTFMIALLSIAIVGVLTILVLTQLGQTSVISTNVNANNTIQNVSNAIPTFFANAGTWLTLLSIVIIVLVVVIVIRVFQPGGQGTGSL